MSTETTELALEENDTLTQFQALGLDMRALNAVTRLELNDPTDVQCEAIPPFVRGRDVVATAPTGTGKTLAFVLPMIEILARAKRELKRYQVGAVIVSPTRELAKQIHEVAAPFVRTLGKERSETNEVKEI